MPAPALPPARWEPNIALERPDFDRMERTDPPLARAQADRVSGREYAERPLERPRLAEFLFRVGRIHDVWQPAPGVTIAARPFPSAGALYELELYVAARDCQGIARGLHHYVADRHELATVPGAEDEAAAMLTRAAAGMNVATAPHALVVIAARPERVANRYGPLSYSLVLKNVGVVMELMYLSATAMGLAGCAVGAGDADSFARATRLHRDEETSVGEFALGPPPD